MAQTSIKSYRFKRIAFAFFLSGAAALIYQVCWQRLLFAVVGVDIESVTLIVSAFMLGLGLGAALGGYLADRFAQHIVAFFCAIEVGIAAFGLVSVGVIDVAAEFTSGAPHAVAAAVSFFLFLPATLLMGATLPMLIAHAVQSSGNVGVSTGGLYAINTLGAALGALSVGFLLLYWFDLRETVQIAAVLNVLAALAVASLLRRRTKAEV